MHSYYCCQVKKWNYSVFQDHFLFLSVWTLGQQLVQKAAQLCKVFFLFAWGKQVAIPRKLTVVPSKPCIWQKWVTREGPHVPSSLFYPHSPNRGTRPLVLQWWLSPSSQEEDKDTFMGRQTPGHSCPKSMHGLDNVHDNGHSPNSCRSYSVFAPHPVTFSFSREMWRAGGHTVVCDEAMLFVKALIWPRSTDSFLSKFFCNSCSPFVAHLQWFSVETMLFAQ